jgi:hypothetical protein
MLTVENETRTKSRSAAEARSGYDPATFRPLTFFDAVARFRAGEDDPRRYLERCLEVIAAREPLVQAWVVSERAPGAREAGRTRRPSAGESGKPLSPIDGMADRHQDLIRRKGHADGMMVGRRARGHFPKRDSGARGARLARRRRGDTRQSS